MGNELSHTPLAPGTVGLMEGLATTRAIRRYLDEPVPDHALRDMLFAATRAPSGSNRQPFRFVVLTEGERLCAVGAFREAGLAARHWLGRTTAGARHDGGSSEQRKEC